MVATGLMVARALEAAEQLAAEGIELEVIDPRTLVPLDMETIVASVERTGRALVVHEAVRTAGAGAEIAARIQEAAFFALDAPVWRLGAIDTPIPQDPDLEQLCIPSVSHIADAPGNSCGSKSTVRQSTVLWFGRFCRLSTVDFSSPAR